MVLTFKKRWLVLLVIDILALLLAFFSGEFACIILILLAFSNIMVYCLSDFGEHCLLFSFMVAFFTFLIGREALERFGLHKVQYPQLRYLDTFAEKQVLFSLILVMAGYFLAKITERKKRSYSLSSIIVIHSKNELSIRQISRYFFLLTYVVNLMLVAEIFIVILRSGYVAFYTGFQSRIPYVIRKVGEMSPIAFWIYMSTLPRKKEAMPNIILFVIYLGTTLLTGQRSVFVTGLLTLFVYFVLRDKWNASQINLDGKWLGKKEKIVCAAAIPLLIILLYLINVIRMGKNFSAESSNAIVEFIYGQGVSINVIKRVERYKNFLPKNKIYTFGSIIDFLQGNLFSRLMGVKHYSGNNVEHALYGPSLAHALSYYVLGKYDYIAGNGIGSSFIAEAYHDWGYYGIAAVSSVYGFALRKLFRNKKMNIWIMAILLVALNSIFMAPRGSADQFVADLVDMTTWGTFLIIWIVSKIKRN